MTTLIIAAVATATNLTTTLPTVVVEASRLGKAPMEMARHVETISEAQIAASDAKNLPELASHIPGLNVYHLGAGNPALAQIQMRGYGENGFGRVLLSVDGEHLNSFDMYWPNYARIPLGGVRKIEILYGPQTVLYGDSASAGMINVVTDPGDYERKTYGEVHGGSWGTAGIVAGTRGGFEEDGIGYYADMGYDRSDGYRDNSDYDIWNAQGGIRKDFANGSFLRVSTFFNDSRYDLPGPLSYWDYKNDPTKSVYRDSAHLTTYGVNFSGRGVINDENTLNFIFTFSQRRSVYSNDDDYGGYTYLRDYESNLWNYRFAPQYTCTADLLGFRNEFLFGGELKYNLLHGDSHDRYPEMRIDSRETYDTDRLTAGAFMHEEFWLFDPLSVLVGARLERDWNSNSLATQGGHTDNFAAGEAALNYRPVESAKIFLRWCEFYRNPFTDEYRWRDGIRSETTEPETGWDAELGAAWDITDEWFASIVAYYSETKNEIHYNPFAMSNENSPWLHRREGIDLACGWERDKVAGFRFAWNGVNAIKAEGDYEGNWVPGVPRQQLNLDGRVWIWDEFSVSGGYRLIGTRYAISDTPNANGRLSVVSVFRLGCRYEPTWWKLEGLSLAFTCENLFNQRYCDYAVASVTSGENAWYPAAGRSFTFTVRYEF